MPYSTPRPPTLLTDAEHRGDTARRRFKEGKALRLYAGHYVLLDEWRGADRLERFLVQLEALRSHQDPVFCCESALMLLGVPTFGVPEHITTVARGGRFGEQGSRHALPAGMTFRERGGNPLCTPVPHHHHDHRDAEIVKVGRFSVVAGPRAAAHVLAKGDLRHALTIADAMVRAGSSRVESVAAELRAVRQPAVRDRAMRRLEAGRAGAASPAESGSRAVLLGAGFPEPELQHEFWDDRGRVGFGDLWWPRLKLLAEVDGKGKYFDPLMTQGLSPAEVLRREKDRENRLLLLIQALRRWPWAAIQEGTPIITAVHSAGLRATEAVLL